MGSRHFFAFGVRQRSGSAAAHLVAFVASAKDIMHWAGIKRVGEHEKGTQRILKPTRVRAIQRFFRKDGRNIIPTSVILAFEPERARFEPLDIQPCTPKSLQQEAISDRLSLGVLSFEYEEQAEEYNRPAFIVDGQHRLQAMAGIEEELPIFVVALLDASPEEQAFQFVVINNKAAKVQTDNVKAIIANIDENDLRERLTRAGISYGSAPAALRDIDDEESSPFYHLLNWPLNPEKKQRSVELTTVETCLRYIKDQFRGFEEDEETVKQVFVAIWSAIKTNYPDLWLGNEKFMSKVNLVALNTYVTDRLVYAAESSEDFDIYDPAVIEARTREIVDPIPSALWASPWGYTLQDNAVVRSLIEGDLRTIVQNVKARTPRPWYEKLKLVGKERALS